MLKFPDERRSEGFSRKRRTRAEVQELVAEFMSSGIRRSEFCRSRGVSFSTLDRHLKKRGWKRRRRPVSSVGRLLKVALVAKKSPTQHDVTCGLQLCCRAGSGSRYILILIQIRSSA